MRETQVIAGLVTTIGLAVAGLLGIGLANYAESGAFAFYKQPHSSGLAIAASDNAPVVPTVYQPAYPASIPPAPSVIDARYPVWDYAELPSQRAVYSEAMERIGADMREPARAEPARETLSDILPRDAVPWSKAQAAPEQAADAPAADEEQDEQSLPEAREE